MKKAFFLLVVLAVFAPAMAFAQSARWAEVNVAYYTTWERDSISVYVSATSERHAEGLAIVEFEKKHGGKADRAIFIRWLTQAEYTQIQKQVQERERQARQEWEQAEKHEQKDFYGTWHRRVANGAIQTLTITEKNFNLKADNGSSWTMEIKSWEAMSNPSGYRLTGSLTDKKEYGMEPPVRLYLFNGGKSLKWFFLGQEFAHERNPFSKR